MIDIKLVRESPEIVKDSQRKRRKGTEIVDKVGELDRQWREIIQEVNKLKYERNLITTEVSKLKKEGKDARNKIKESQEIGRKISKLDFKARENKERRDRLLLNIPNILEKSVPIGKDEKDNVPVKYWGKKPKFDFKPKSHLEIALNLGIIDAERAANTSGSGFFYLKNELVLLDLAIQRFAIDQLLKKGFTLIEPPFIINRRAYEGMIGSLSEIAEVSYKIEGDELYLIPTAEYPLGSMFTDEVFDKKDLPLKLIGISPAFRKEVGTHGKYAKGLFRMHQFNKIEQFVFCIPEQSWDILEELQRNSEELYQKLELHHRVVIACTGDTPAKVSKMYDIEVWMADGKFREIGSNSNCTDYQARRLNIKYKEKEGAPPKGFVHTLNNTALATSRTMIAILEQYQKKDGSVKIPKVLYPYLAFKEITPKK